MNQTLVRVLTPPGVGAIAVVSLVGGHAWSICRALFRTPSGHELPAEPIRRVWTGRFGEPPGDQIVLSVQTTEPEPCIEIHCHGGRRVTDWIVTQCHERGAVETSCELEALRFRTKHERAAAELLPYALTERTAGILLDQMNGAMDAAIADPVLLREARQYIEVGRHLTRPWRVVVAGSPNVGKSSLMNALAGFPRSVVTPTAGTTRDMVTVGLALDGWPVQLIDTAGLRRTDDRLEYQGIEATSRAASNADLVVWVSAVDVPESAAPTSLARALHVCNKCDLGTAIRGRGISVSAATGAGLETLTQAIVNRLVPHAPPPGAAVPFSEEIVDSITSPQSLLASAIEPQESHLP